MGTWLNRYETDSPLWVRRMDSASMVEMSMHWKNKNKVYSKFLCGRAKWNS